MRIVSVFAISKDIYEENDLASKYPAKLKELKRNLEKIIKP